MAVTILTTIILKSIDERYRYQCVQHRACASYTGARSAQPRQFKIAARYHMKTIAIMQPYFLPYLGYFQLLAAVDKFVLLDDVNYIRGGWINRNRMLMNGAPHLFTLPLRGASQNRPICDIALAEDSAWRDKLLRSINQAYGRGPYYSQVIGLLEQTLHCPYPQLDQFLLNSLRQAMCYLSLETELAPTTRAYANDELAGDRRIIDICVREGATHYINPIERDELVPP